MCIRDSRNTGIKLDKLHILEKDPKIVSQIFMGNDPEACIGYITDTTYKYSEQPYESYTAYKGRHLANMIASNYLNRRNAYIGHWASQAKIWVEFRKGRTWK